MIFTEIFPSQPNLSLDYFLFVIYALVLFFVYYDIANCIYWRRVCKKSILSTITVSKSLSFRSLSLKTIKNRANWYVCYVTDMDNWQGISFAWSKKQIYLTSMNNQHGSEFWKKLCYNFTVATPHWYMNNSSPDCGRLFFVKSTTLNTVKINNFNSWLLFNSK